MAENSDSVHGQLLATARTAAARAYAPYSGYRVGTALHCRGDGAVFSGCNVENASYGLSLCAERVATVAAVAAGRRSFDTLAIYAEGELLPMPCGACRQFLAEFGSDLVVVVSNGARERSFLLAELFPHPFDLRSLDDRSEGPGQA